MYIKKMMFHVCSLSAFLSPINTILNVNHENYWWQKGTQQNIYMLATKYEEINQKPGTLKYDEMKTSIGNVTESQLGIKVDKLSDLNVSLQIIANNPINKSVDVIYVIHKKGFNEASGIITIYAKDRTPNPDYDDVQNVARRFQQLQTTSHGSFYPDSWSVDDELTAEDLGITEPTIAGVKITYNIIKIDLKTGIILVNALIVKGEETAYLKIKVIGFKTFEEQNEEEFNNVLKQIEEKIETENPIYPEFEIGTKVSPNDLGIKKIQTSDEIQIEYEVKQVDQDTGEVTVEVKITNGSKEVTKTTKVTGFETKNQRDKKNLDKVMEKITDDTSNLINEFPDWKIGDKVTPEQLGINPLDGDLDNVKVEYEVKELIPETGTVILEVTGTIGDKVSTKTITVNGFKSEDDINTEEINKVKEIIDTKYKDITLDSASPWTKKLPSMAQESFANNLTDDNLQELNIPLLTAEEKQTTIVDYKISSVNNDSGEATIEVVITKNKVASRTSFIVKGFENTNNYNQKIVEESYKQIQDANKISEENNVINLVSNSSYSNRLPSKIKINVGENLSSSQLRNFNINLTNKLKAKITSTLNEINDQNGTAKIVISISSGEINKQLTIVVNGFKTKGEQDKKDVSDLKYFLEDKYKDVQIPSKSNDKNLLPSEIKKELKSENLNQESIKRLGFEILTEKILKEAKVNYKIFDSNDGNGQLIIWVEITQGEVSDNFTFQIKGFQTQNHRNQIEVDEALEKFKKDNPDPTIDEASDLANKTLLDANYKVGTILTGSLLSKLNLVIDNQDFEIDKEFRVKAIDNENGILTVELTFTKGYAEAKTDIVISGFLKTSILI